MSNDCGHAKCIAGSDEDLLALNPFRGIAILSYRISKGVEIVVSSASRLAGEMKVHDGNSTFRSSAMDAAASRHTTSITTGLASAVAAAPVAGRPTFTFLLWPSLPKTHYSLLGSLPGIAAALCGALLLGRGHAYAQRP